MGRIVLAFVSVAAVFSLLELLYRSSWPADEDRDADAQRRFGLRRDTRTDLIYSLFTPLVTRAIRATGVVLAVLLLAWVQGVELDLDGGSRNALRPFFEGSPISAQALWLQGIEVALLLDLSSYWIHRLFHRGRLWPFHAVHHSSRRLTWLSSVRLHPVNDLLTRIIQAVLLLVIGFNPLILAALIPFTGLYAVLLHARVPWDFGPLRYVIASPVFHRWHHTCAVEGRDKNFAGFFPIWDLLFGTFYLPGAPPTHFGVDEPVPVTFLAQLTWPFRRHRPGPSEPGDPAEDTPQAGARGPVPPAPSPTSSSPEPGEGVGA